MDSQNKNTVVVKEYDPTSPESVRLPVGMYMLLWFTNPSKEIEDNQGLCTQFYMSLDEAKKKAELLSGDRIILMCTFQNPSPDLNVYWNPVKTYGESFDLKELTILSEDLRKKILEQEPEDPNGIG